MMFSTLVLALAYAQQDSETLNLPWEMSLIESDGDCPQVCGNWSALFLSDSGCKGKEVVGETLRFCPDKQAVEAWTMEKELVYAAMHTRKDSLLKPAREMFRRMTYEREMKLSVHPWQKFSAQEISDVQERRRIKGSMSHMSCKGEKTGTRARHYKDEKPEKVTTQFTNDALNYIELQYPSAKMQVGTLVDNGTEKKQGLPDCVQVVFVKFDGTRVNGLQFLSQGQETRFFGSDDSESFIYIAPSGHCLADSRIRGDELIDRFCIRFNVADN